MAREPRGMREVVRAALTNKDHNLLNAAAALAGSRQEADVFEAVAREELAKQPHDIHEFWEGPCNCQGQHN